MDITIRINCETIEDFLVHLKKLSMQVTEKMNSCGLTPKSDFADGSGLEHSDDLGTHDVIISPSTD